MKRFGATSGLLGVRRGLAYPNSGFPEHRRIGNDNLFPGYFQPTWGLPKNDGTTLWALGRKDLAPEMIARWKQHS